MPTWLMVALGVVGGGILALIVLWLVFRLVVKRFLKKLVSTLDNLGGGPGVPPRATLVPAEELEWAHGEAIEKHMADLRRAGFEAAGLFTIEEMPGVNLAGMVHRDEQIWSAVYEHPSVGPVVDLVCTYEDDRSLTVTSTAQGEGLVERLGHRKVRLEGADVVTLLETLRRERPDGPLEEALPDRFKERFERTYAEEMDWRNARGGPDEEEIAAVAEARGMEVSEEEVRTAREIMREQAGHGLEEGRSHDLEAGAPRGS